MAPEEPSQQPVVNGGEKEEVPTTEVPAIIEESGTPQPPPGENEVQEAETAPRAQEEAAGDVPDITVTTPGEADSDPTLTTKAPGQDTPPENKSDEFGEFQAAEAFGDVQVEGTASVEQPDDLPPAPVRLLITSSISSESVHLFRYSDRYRYLCHNLRILSHRMVQLAQVPVP